MFGDRVCLLEFGGAFLVQIVFVKFAMRLCIFLGLFVGLARQSYLKSFSYKAPI